MTQPTEDRTPPDYVLPQPGVVELFIKRPVRRYGYPLYNLVVDRLLRARFSERCPFHVDQWLWGQRGNDYETHRRRINSLLPLRGTRLLIAGCGTGRDVLSWLPYQLASVIGVDYFRYDRVWDKLRAQVAESHPATRLEFAQGNLADLSMVKDNTIDVVGSDAVFEHLGNLRDVTAEFWRVLRPGGLLYATFGPLWYCWGGDHISGYDSEASGYNHIVLPKEEYQSYLDAMGPFHHSEHDGRTWIMNGLFSYLRPPQYLNILEQAGFLRRYVAVIVEPRATRCLANHAELRQRLLREHSELDLIITGMTIIYEKPATFS